MGATLACSLRVSEKFRLSLWTASERDKASSTPILNWQLVFVYLGQQSLSQLFVWYKNYLQIEVP